MPGSIAVAEANDDVDADKDTDSDEKQSDAASKPNREKRERVFTVATFLLIAIVSVGLILIWFVAIWGGRLRRLARKQAATPSVVDELWYLKPKKTIPQSNLDQRGELDANSNETERP